MGKKKKKNAPSSSPSPNHPASLSLAATPRSSSSAAPPLATTTCLRLQVDLRNHKSSNANKTVVVLTPEDCHRLRLSPHQDVLVLSSSSSSLHNNNDSGHCPIQGCAIAKVSLAMNQTTTTTPHSGSGSHRRSNNHNTKDRLVAPGFVQIASPHLQQLLWPNDDSQDVDTAISDQTPTKKPPPAPSTPTTTNNSCNSKDQPFSFLNLVATTQESSTPNRTALRTTTRSTPSPQKQQQSSKWVWILPLDSKRGRQLIHGSLSRPVVAVTRSTTLTLQWTSDDNAAITIPQERILAQLVRATHSQSYVQEGEVLPVSFQGRLVHVKCVSVQGAHADPDTAPDPKDGANAERLTDALQQMTLEDEDDDEEWNQLVSMIGNGEFQARLFQITRDTHITFLDSKEDSASQTTTTTEQRLVAGLDAVVQQVREQLQLCLFPTTNNTMSKPPRGVLLHGPSGVGKSCLARQVGHEFLDKCRVEFVSCVSLQSQTSVVGQAEQTLSRYIRGRGASHGNNHGGRPRLLILDDIDLIGSKRGELSTSGSDALTATLLALLDGVESTTATLPANRWAILGVTSDPSALDPALRRPGRLDVEVEVPLPDEPGQRAEILEFHWNHLIVQVGPDPSLQISKSQWLDLARLAKGFNGADCVLAVKEAVRLALRRQSKHVSESDLACAIRSIRPSAIQSVTVEIPQVQWSDIGGMEQVKTTLREAIELPESQVELYQKLRLTPPKGILLYGPPGTGKTMIARALATEGKMNFLAVKGPELLSKWLGESERALASLFRRARMASPAILFFDEIDAIATKRGSSDSSSGSRMLSQLLTELDGVRTTAVGSGDLQRQRVVVIGATNRPDILDSALTRPGRIDRMVYVGLPDQPSREKVFEVALKGRACCDDVNLERLSQEEVSGGYSGAELVGICREAALLALDECCFQETTGRKQEDGVSTPAISMQHLMDAVGTTKQQITPEMLEFYSSFHRG